MSSEPGFLRSQSGLKLSQPSRRFSVAKPPALEGGNGRNCGIAAGSLAAPPPPVRVNGVREAGVGEESSDGISKASFVREESETIERVRYIHEIQLRRVAITNSVVFLASISSFVWALPN